MSLLGSNLAHKLACDVDFGPVWSNIYGCDVWATANLLCTFYNDSSDFFPVFLLNSKQTKKHNTKNTYLASCHKGNVKKVWKRMSVRLQQKTWEGSPLMDIEVFGVKQMCWFTLTVYCTAVIVWLFVFTGLSEMFCTVTTQIANDDLLQLDVLVCYRSKRLPVMNSRSVLSAKLRFEISLTPEVL